MLERTVDDILRELRHEVPYFASLCETTGGFGTTLRVELERILDLVYADANEQLDEAVKKADDEAHSRGYDVGHARGIEDAEKKAEAAREEGREAGYDEGYRAGTDDTIAAALT